MPKARQQNPQTAEILRNAAAKGTASAIKEFVAEAMKTATKYGHLRHAVESVEMQNILKHALSCALCAAAWLEEMEEKHTASGEE